MPIPNLYLAASHIATPRRWFSKQQRVANDTPVALPGQPLALTEHWNSPVPGVYRHKPGAGWFLIQLDSDPSKPTVPDRVIFCAPLNRGILESDYNARCMKAKLPKVCQSETSNSSGSSCKKSAPNSPAVSRNNSYVGEIEPPEVSFVLHNDGITWLNDKDDKGKPTHGPWQRFCIDKTTGEMRVMTKGDDPNWKGKAEPQVNRRNGNDNSRPPSYSSRPPSYKSHSSNSAASDIRELVPELDGRLHSPSFLGPRSIHGSPRSSTTSSPAISRRGSLQVLHETSVGKNVPTSPRLQEKCST